MKNHTSLHFILLAALILLTNHSCKVGRFVVYNFADINDHKKFPVREMERGATHLLKSFECCILA